MIYLCGTKCDLVEENKKARKVDLHLTKEYADGRSVPNIVRLQLYCSVAEIAAKYTETSAKTGYNIDTLFMMIAEDFVSITRQKVQANQGERIGIPLQYKDVCEWG